MLTRSNDAEVTWYGSWYREEFYEEVSGEKEQRSTSRKDPYNAPICCLESQFQFALLQDDELKEEGA